MVSAAERLASNMNFSVLGKAKELKQRIWFVVLALIVYRIGTYIPLSGIDPLVLAENFGQQSGGVLGMFNTFSGGALERMSIFALGVLPYISASIAITLMTPVIPHLENLKKEGSSGQMKINQYTRYGTVLLAFLQGLGIAVGMENWTGPSGSAVIDPGWFFRLSTAISIMAGTVFLMWLGEQMTSRGVGNGISLIIYAGIIAAVPEALAGLFEMGRTGRLSTAFIVAVLIGLGALVYLIVWVERAQRRIIVQYPKRQIGNKVMQGDSSHLPLKVNTAGVIPAIFASAMLMLPLTLAGFNPSAYGTGFLGTVTAYLGRGQPLYLGLYAAMIIFFTFFYTALQFNVEQRADELKKYGGFIPGIRPGKHTAEYLDYVLTRLTTVGAIYLAFVCVTPEIFLSNYAISFAIGGTGLLIIVNITIDTVGQIQSHLFAHQYEGLIKKANLRGRKR